MEHIATFDLEARLLTVTDDRGACTLQTALDVGATFDDALNPHGLALKPGTVWRHTLGSRHMGAQIVRRTSDAELDAALAPVGHWEDQLMAPAPRFTATDADVLGAVADFATRELAEFVALFPNGATRPALDEYANGTRAERWARAETLLRARGLHSDAVQE